MGEWPKRLRFAVAGAVAVESLLTAAGAVYLSVGLATEEATERDAASWETAIAWVAALGLGALVVGVLRRRGWARGPVITVQLLALPVSWSMLGSEKWYLGAVLGAAALVGLTGVHPEVLGTARPATAPEDHNDGAERSIPPR